MSLLHVLVNQPSVVDDCFAVLDTMVDNLPAGMMMVWNSCGCWQNIYICPIIS